ncbi:hypothetical protein C6P42_001793 [Pichia californica]|nr:hypothetical protein C6P42_001793 [[Candida] californica]
MSNRLSNSYNIKFNGEMSREFPAEQERSTDVLLALQRLEETLVNAVTRLGEEMRDNFNVVNYRLSVMENDALVRSKRSTI